MKKILLLALLLMFVFINSGCDAATTRFFEDKHEIENMDFVRGMGIDFINEKFRVSFVLEGKSSTSSDQENAKAQQTSHTEVFYADGDSISEAVFNIDAISDKHLFLGMLDFFILGENIAKSDVIKAIDFISRHTEIRMISGIYVSKGMNAIDFLKNSTKLSVFVGKKIEGHSKSLSLKRYVAPTEVLKIMTCIDNNFIGYVIPTVSITSEHAIKEGKELLNVIFDEYAVFKNNKLLTYVDDNEILYGINIINGNVSTAIVNVKILDNVPVALKVLNIGSDISSSFREQDPTINIDAHIESNISELMKPVNIFTPEYFDMLDKQQEIYIKRCMKKAVDFSQHNDVDILNLSGTLNRQHPYKWESIKNNWSKIFSQIPVEVNVKSQIRRTYDIRQTQGTKVEK